MFAPDLFPDPAVAEPDILYKADFLTAQEDHESQGEELGMRVHLTHAAYSSQECNKCHHVSRDNRKTQELFCCVACNYTAPADFVAAKNLKERLVSDVLRPALHTFGRAQPKPIYRAALKSLLTRQGAGGVIDLMTPATSNKELLSSIGRTH